MILNLIKLFIFRVYWKSMNKGTKILPMNCFNLKNVTSGINSYGDLNVVSFSDKAHLKIGNYVSIAQDVKFLLDVEHNIDCISTYPFKVKVLNYRSEAFSKGNIEVCDDVWIGYGSIILSGVKIGKGAVIAAGSVVTKDVPPYAVFGGVPAKLIKYRFNNDIIEKLLELDYSKLNCKIIKNNISVFYDKDVTIEKIEYLINTVNENRDL